MCFFFFFFFVVFFVVLFFMFGLIVFFLFIWIFWQCFVTLYHCVHVCWFPGLFNWSFDFVYIRLNILSLSSYMFYIFSLGFDFVKYCIGFIHNLACLLLHSVLDCIIILVGCSFESDTLLSLVCLFDQMTYQHSDVF